MAESKFSLEAPIFFWETEFHGVPPLTNNTTQTFFGEDLVKIRPAIAEQSRQNRKKNRRATKI